MFKGFRDSETFSQIPDIFFQQLLKEITDADELKVTLYALWRIERMDGPFRALRETDFDTHELGIHSDEIRSGLEKAEKRGSLIKSVHATDVFYFINSPRGRAAAEAFGQGQWQDSAQVSSAPLEHPNAFKLYEENIGPLTPLIADALKAAEQIYSEAWLADAIELAVQNNKRSWKYCEAILKRWKEEGRGEKQNRPDTKKDRERAIDRKIQQLRSGSK